MEGMKPRNPFIVAGYHSPEYFCGRERETAEIVSAVCNERCLRNPAFPVALTNAKDMTNLGTEQPNEKI